MGGKITPEYLASLPFHFRGGTGTWDAVISRVYAARCWAAEEGDQDLVRAYLELEEVLVNLRRMDETLS